jgi:peptide deformylase
MAVKDVVLYPDRRLKEVCAPAWEAHLAGALDIQQVAQDLIETMRSFPGCVGIAAPQIGELVRMAVVDATGHPKAKSCAGLTVLVDPVIEESDGRVKMREGCLSIPDLTGNVHRVKTVRVRYRDLAGESQVLEADAFEARIILHEMDHLDGILFLDRVASAKDVFARKTYR